ncbi:hypothetical protein H5410_036537 [Solanum commersonii]|uniref:Uncharacterized protein n=1 Tax=Solanum commersonii TaxID=4109 RepID=A0A9J5Y4I2_SOLCO|nr:hypothetical protein H5410_036537 [Solanum commersonii]
MIKNTIKAQYGGLPQNSLGYSKSYSKQIEGLLMSIIIVNDSGTTKTNHASVNFDHKKDSVVEVLCPVVSPNIEE